MQRILAAVDLSDTTDEVIDMALALSYTERARLCIIHVERVQPAALAGSWGEVEYLPSDNEELDREAMNRLHERLQQRGAFAECMIAHGEPNEELKRAAKKLNADLVILGAHEHGLLGRAFSPRIREQFLHHAPCPVLVVPHRGVA